MSDHTEPNTNGTDYVSDSEFDSLIAELQSITEEARATDYHDTLRKAALFLNLHRAKVIQYANDIVRLDAACTEQHDAYVSACNRVDEINDLDYAKAQVRSAGYSLVSAEFISNFAEFIQDWRKGDFDLPKLAALDVKACFDAWQAGVNQAEVNPTKELKPNPDGTDYVSDAQFDALIAELQSITEEARATDYHDALRKAVLFLNLHRAKVIQYAKDIVRLDGACTEQHAVNVSVCKQLAEANKVIRLAGDALKKTAAPSVSYEILGVIHTYLEGKK